MSNRVSLEDVEQMAEQLRPPDRLKLVAHICDQLSEAAVERNHFGDAEAGRLSEVDAWLAECDAVAQSIEGEFDSAEEIREIRHRRADRL